MTQPKRDKLTSNNKDTRWDRIRKRHSSNFSTYLKSDAVKRLIEMDYIGRNKQDVLIAENNLKPNLDPVLVMNLRHELFKKFPRKLPLATLAYSKNLQQCKDHNITVENHYIDNQLNQFRKHLQKRHEQNNVPARKLHSLLIDNTNIMNSLNSAHQHIEDFYNTPIDALHEVHDLFAGELEKHVKHIQFEKLRECELTGVENIQNNLRNLEEKEGATNELISSLFLQQETNLNTKDNDNALESLIEDDSSKKEVVDLETQSERDVQRTPSPLDNTEEILQPLRKVMEDKTAAHLKFVRFDDDINIFHPKKEVSICSNTSDGIDSVISDIPEDTFKEFQIEEVLKTAKIVEKKRLELKDNKKNLSLNELPLDINADNRNLLVIDKVALHIKSSFTEHEARNSNNIFSEETEDYLNKEQSNIIKDLYKTHVNNKVPIIRKYFLKWVHYTTIEKIEREHVDVKADHMKRINVFLNKIRIEKNRLHSRRKTEAENDSILNKGQQKKESGENLQINKKYQNKIKVQQDIIDLQRLKLERQERIIMELKLHKLTEEAKEERMELKNELKSVVRLGDPKSKAKAKCLQIIGNLKDEEDNNLNKLQGKSFLMPKFLQSMQERALERSIRHEQAKQRRQQQEAEKEAQKLALEEAKRLEDEETKHLRIEALKEKRRQEKMAKIIKERERQKYIENQRKAQDFYKRILLKHIGMEGFKRLLQRKKDNIKKCDILRQSLYKRTYFQAWFSVFRIYKARRNQKADELYEKILKRKYIQIWLQYTDDERCKFNIAVDYNEFKLIEIMFQKWWAYMKRMQLIEKTKMNQAISHHEWHLKWKVLDCWQRLPQILKLEKETEERRQRWRLKIWELLPDYTPNRDDLQYM